MELAYPAGPAAVPANLVEPARELRRLARLAGLALAIYLIAWVALAAWLAVGAARLLGAAVALGENWGWMLAAGLTAGWLAIVVTRPLFARTRAEAQGLEVSAAEQPRLSGFLYRLADEARAPRPQRVFVSARMTATLSWHVSVANLLLRPALHLEIGLPLVSSLSLAEFRAVLAHELAHFSRRMPTSARWVYLAWRVVAHLLGWRDRFDAALQKLSQGDIRIAWLWRPLVLLASALRSLLELAFRDLVHAQRRLAREIEARADVLTVSLAGSDALVHALHRLRDADRAWTRASAFLASEQAAGRPVADAIAIHERMIELLRVVHARPDLGLAPPLPRAGAEHHRLFTPENSLPPRMWSMHPSNAVREQIMKRVYVPAPLDGRPAWDLFDDTAGLRNRVSAASAPHDAGAPAPLGESLQRLNEMYQRACLGKTFRGAYLDRSPARLAARPADLYDALPDPPAIRALNSLYPESLGAEVVRAVELEQELARLEDARRTRAPAGFVRHRDRVLQLAEIPHAIAQLREEIAALNRSLTDHERRCRAAHLAAAASLKSGWEEYLRGLGRVLHYAEHTAINLRDAHGFLVDVVTRVTARRRMNEAELEELLQAAADVHDVLRTTHGDAKEVVLDRTVARRLHAESWLAYLGEYALELPNAETINSWLRAIDGAVSWTTARLDALRDAALDQLLLSEAQVARFVRQRLAPGAAPPPSRVPVTSTVVLPGQERVRRAATGRWHWLETSESPVPMLSRVAIAAAVLVTILVATIFIGGSIVTIYNGFARIVRVSVDRADVDVPALSTAKLTVHDEEVRVAAHALDGRIIEEFEASLPKPGGAYVYNVAGLSPLVEWTATYGKATGESQRELGTPRWLPTTADYLFVEPPSMLQTESGSAARTVLAGMADSRPEQILSMLPEAGHARIIDMHARWDDSGWRHTGLWLLLASERPGFRSALAHRLAATPHDALALRLEQDTTTTPRQHAHVCKRHAALAAAAPTNADLQYIATRCLPSEKEKKAAFLRLHRSWPENGWLALAAGNAHAEEGRWVQAQVLLEQARLQVPALADFLAIDVARLRRMVAGAEPASLDDLERDSALLGFLRATETGAGFEQSPLLAYRELASGRLAEALDRAAGAMEPYARVLRLAAASDGASAELVTRALELPLPQGIDHDTIWAAIGLAAREKVPLEPYYEFASKVVRVDVPAMRTFIEAIRSGTAPESADAALEGTHMKSRAHAYSAAVILLGNEAPAPWRERARRMLFAYERPWFE
jgi:hypothetical protein